MKAWKPIRAQNWRSVVHGRSSADFSVVFSKAGGVQDWSKQYRIFFSYNMKLTASVISFIFIFLRRNVSFSSASTISWLNNNPKIHLIAEEPWISERYLQLNCFLKLSWELFIKRTHSWIIFCKAIFGCLCRRHFSLWMFLVSSI